MNSASRILRALLFLVLAAGLLGAYAAVRFRGLSDPSALDSAQLARTLAAGGGYRTLCIRPADIGWFHRHRLSLPESGPIPELRRPPLHPYLLSRAFRLFHPAFRWNRQTHRYPPETRVIVPFGLLFILLTAGLVYVLTAMLFGSTQAAVAAWIFILSDSILEIGLSGTAEPLALFLVTGASAAALAAVLAERDGRSAFLRYFLIGLAGLASGLAVLTVWHAAALGLAPVLLLATTLRRNRFLALLLFLVLSFAVVFPWLVRNVHETGAPFGIAPATTLNHTVLHPGRSFDRSPDPATGRSFVFPALQAKLLDSLPRLADRRLRLLGTGLIVCLFLASFFGRFDSDSANSFRWTVAAAAGALLLFAAFATHPRSLDLLVPFAVVIGTGFAFELTESRTLWPPDLWRPFLSAALLVTTAVPLAAALFFRPPAFPYPPLYPPFVQAAAERIPPGSALCTDLPEAAAWYGRVRSLLLPRTPEDLSTIRSRNVSIGGIYLTQSSLRDHPWRPLFLGRIPQSLPFTNGIAFPPETRDQIFIGPVSPAEAPDVPPNKQHAPKKQPAGDQAVSSYRRIIRSATSSGERPSVGT